MRNPTVSPPCGKRKAAGLRLEQPRLQLSFLLNSFLMKMLVRTCREFSGMQLTPVVHGELLRCVCHQVGLCCLLTKLSPQLWKAGLGVFVSASGWVSPTSCTGLFLSVFFFFQVFDPTPLSFLTIFSFFLKSLYGNELTSKTTHS